MDSSEKIELSSSDKLQNEDTLASKLSREAQLLLGGAMLGLAQTTGDRLGNHLTATAVETAAFAGLSYGMVRLASSATPMRYALPVLTAAMGYSFVGNMMKEFPQKAEMLSTAWKDTWHSPANLKSRQQEVADTLGPFLFDTSLGMVAGLAGGRLAARQIENKAILNYMKQNYGNKIDESVFRVASEPNAKGLRQMGSAFAVADDKLATAFHVVQDKPGQSWTFINASEKGQVKVLAGLPQRDLALMQYTEGAHFKALPIAKSMDTLPQSGVVVGALGKKMEVRPANFMLGAGRNMNDYTADLGPAVGGGFGHMVKGGSAWRGMSGGPAIAQSGEVVGVMSTVNPLFNLANIGTDSTPSTSLRHLMSMVEKSKTPGSTMTLPEAMKELKLPAGEIMSRLDKGKLHGFLVPSASDTNAWSWLIMKR